MHGPETAEAAFFKAAPGLLLHMVNELYIVSSIF